VPRLTRRSFLKIGGAAVGAAALGVGVPRLLLEPDREAPPDPGTDGERVVPTFCELCFWKCGVLAHVRGGRVTKIVGNPLHPLSNGRLCPRGVGGTGLLYDPDRLKRPLVRARRRGEEVFVEVGWPEALDRTAEGLRLLRERYGPESLAFFTHGFGGSWFSRLVRAYGSPNVAAPSYAQCRGPREVGYALTFGQGLGSPEPLDIENARCVTLIGSHLGENMHNTQVQELAEAIGRGAELVVVDPRFSTAAGKARHWLPIRPGADTALLLAWMHVILAEGREDAAYLARHAIGLEELRAHVRTLTPEWAAPITGIAAERIRETARFVAGFRPASLIHPGRRAVWNGEDAQRARAMAILAALLGNYGRRGGYLLTRAPELPAAPAPAGSRPAPAPPPDAPGPPPASARPGLKPLPVLPLRADRPRAGGYPFAEEGLASGLRDASLPGDASGAPYPIRGWLVYGTNLLQALPQPARTIEALLALDFVVSVDVLPAEICGWSDVVLPEATYLERDDDVYAADWKRPFLAIRQKAVEPLGESKPGWWIAKELASRLGLGERFDFADALSLARARVEAGGYDWGALRRDGVILTPPAPTCEEEGAALSFPTPSGKIELWSARLAEAGFDPIPVARAPDGSTPRWSAAGGSTLGARAAARPGAGPPPGMLTLLSGRAPAHTFGRTANNRLLASVYPENEVWVAPGAAAAVRHADGRPLEDGERVFLVNQDGAREGPLRAKVTERIRPDCAYLVHGWGHTASGLGTARGRGASHAALVTRVAIDPLMGGTGMNVNFVRLEPEEVRS
jgi:thiosulfate reductase/polysulfide reductase chain A